MNIRDYISEAVSHGIHKSPTFDKEPKDIKTVKDLEQFLEEIGYAKITGYVGSDDFSGKLGDGNMYCTYTNLDGNTVVKIHPHRKDHVFILFSKGGMVRSNGYKEMISDVRKKDQYYPKEILEMLIRYTQVNESFSWQEAKNYLFSCLDRTDNYDFELTLESCPKLAEYYSLSELDIYREFRNHPEYIYLALIVVNEDDQYAGNGTGFMEDLCEWADSRGKTITLTPSDDYGASSVSRLIKFYKRFGFVANKGKHTDFMHKQYMHRKPK